MRKVYYYNIILLLFPDAPKGLFPNCMDCYLSFFGDGVVGNLDFKNLDDGNVDKKLK